MTSSPWGRRRCCCKVQIPALCLQNCLALTDVAWSLHNMSQDLSSFLVCRRDVNLMFQVCFMFLSLECNAARLPIAVLQCRHAMACPCHSRIRLLHAVANTTTTLTKIKIRISIGLGTVGVHTARHRCRGSIHCIDKPRSMRSIRPAKLSTVRRF